MENYLIQLDASQQKAACHKQGPIIILAGAGSGKTRVITYRIVNLIQQGVAANNILALTFTNKAADEMRERIEQKISDKSSQLWMGTFHSIFAKLLRFTAPALGYSSNFSIYDTLDSRSLIKQIIKELNLDDNIYNNARILNRISWAKNNLISVADYNRKEDIIAYDHKSNRPLIGKIYEEYEKRTLASNAMDFDDLLFKFYNLISTDQAILNSYQDKFQYILVDEYQDTNNLQYRIVNLLASKHKNICVVGDDSQSIYSFRGATVQNILNFQKDYPEAQICKLEQNYRSTQVIVNTANKIIKNNTNRLDKNVFSQNEVGGKIELLNLRNESEEAKFIANDIYTKHVSQNIPYNQFAVLYRTNAQSRSIEEAMRKLGIPYNIYGGLSFYSRKEIKDTVAYLRLAINLNDEEAFKRVINYPKRGIGEATIDKILLSSSANNKTLSEILLNIEAYIPTKQAQSIKSFVELIKSFSELAKDSNAYEVVNHVINESGIAADLYSDKTIEGLNKFNNLQEVVNAAKHFVSEAPDNTEVKLVNFLQEIALYNNTDDLNKEEASGHKVSLMTVHSAKGLEFSVVYVVGLENGLFPSQMSIAEANLEEERRLFYVAITRAKKQLVVTNAKERYKYGLRKACEPSIFVKELTQSAGEYINIRDTERSINHIKNKVTTERSTNNVKSKTNIIQGINPSKVYNRANTNQTYNNTNYRLVPLTTQDLRQSTFNARHIDIEKIKIGSKVKHNRFGLGEVVNVIDDPKNAAVTVNFGTLGTKHLLLNYAKLELLS